ncbi:MAG: undecaprenyldiphospho-muramoylpentapeptide beta-N-acetylglucosaminyltransferase [Verrucomicrobiaceae bacterium]|nr:undecaprenyldiphospho-muramoylpentapeptide beta-N-acetylglucosaminyltransferase [Verrucomicrobiaceae bacterium]
MAIRIVIACGGTGGHLFPGIAVAEALRAQGGESLVLISEKEIDALAIKGYDDLCFETVPAMAMPRLLSPKMIPFSLRFLRTLLRCNRIVSAFKADAVLGMGGFTSLAPLMAGRRHGAKVFIHESNAFPGKANRIAARGADSVLLGLSACRRYFPGKDVDVVGTPLRKLMCQKHDKASALAHFGLEEGRKTLLVMGGSQGARGLNQAITGALEHISALGMQVIHLTGPADLDSIRAGYSHASLPYFVSAFCHEMHQAYSAADVAIARSGASSLAELSVFALPTILVPFPHAADDHQTLNAQVYTKSGAAEMLKEKDIESRSIGMLLQEFTKNNGAVLTEMSSAMDAMAIRNAAENICKSIEMRCR